MKERGMPVDGHAEQQRNKDTSEQVASSTYCTGCGSVLQSVDLHLPGYVPQAALDKPQALCRRCYRIRHYGEFTPVVVENETYQRQLATIFDAPGLVLYVVDVFDLAGSIVPNLARFVLTSDVIVIVNKVDLLPQDIHYDALRDWVKNQVEETKVNVSDVLFVSAEKGTGMEDVVLRATDETERPIYVVGMANTGKSTLLNTVIGKFGLSTSPYTVSRRPGTTLSLSTVRAQGARGEVQFVDTPGLIQDTRVIDRLCADCLKLAVPSHRIRPRIYQLNAEQTLFLGGVGRLDFEAGSRQAIVLYVSNDLPVHRTKLENKDAIWRMHQDDLLQVPCARCRPNFGELTSYQIQSVRHGQTVPKGNIAISGRGRDIVIPGLGWIAFSGETFRGSVWLPRWIAPSYRPRLVGDLSRVSREDAWR